MVFAELGGVITEGKIDRDGGAGSTRPQADGRPGCCAIS
jgi:hypothetical protein